MCKELEALQVIVEKLESLTPEERFRSMDYLNSRYDARYPLSQKYYEDMQKLRADRDELWRELEKMKKASNGENK